MPSQPARRLPPGIIDIAAPQLPLEPHQSPQDAQQAAQIIRPVSPIARVAVRPLTAVERLTAKYLRARVGFHYGAEHFLKKHGAPAVRAALRDGVLIFEDGAYGWDARRQCPMSQGRSRWTVNPRLRSPAAYLNRILNDP